MMPADRIERNLTQLMTELAEPRLPDYRDDLIGRVTVTRQRRLVAPWHVERPRLAAAIAAVLVVAIGGVLLLRQPEQGIAPVPSPSATPSSSPLPSPTASGAAAIPLDLRYAWVSAGRSGAGLPAVLGASNR